MPIAGAKSPEEWYKFPIFYFTNPNNIFGPEDEIPYPAYTNEMDYELEIAVVIGKPGRDIKPDEAPQHIFGYTIFNDWSARDVQREEMKVSLGPAKGKDFASSLGPCIVTPDELADRSAGRPGVYDLEMRARVNGVERVAWQFQGYLLVVRRYPGPRLPVGHAPARRRDRLGHGRHRLPARTDQRPGAVVAAG